MEYGEYCTACGFRRSWIEQNLNFDLFLFIFIAVKSSKLCEIGKYVSKSYVERDTRG